MTTTTHRIQDERLLGALAMLLTIGGVAVANFAGTGGNGGAGPFAVSVGVCALLAAVLFGRVLPSASELARAGWILAALALVTCIVFWSGLPFVLGMGAVYCGVPTGRTAPAALGALAIVLALVGCFIG